MKKLAYLTLEESRIKNRRSSMNYLIGSSKSVDSKRLLMNAKLRVRPWKYASISLWLLQVLLVVVFWHILSLRDRYSSLGT
jgi:hypothetical protein